MQALFHCFLKALVIAIAVFASKMFIRTKKLFPAVNVETIFTSNAIILHLLNMDP